MGHYVNNTLQPSVAYLYFSQDPVPGAEIAVNPNQLEFEYNEYTDSELKEFDVTTVGNWTSEINDN